MKKTILSVIALLGITFMMQAQTTTPAKPATDKMSTVAKTTSKKVATTTPVVKKEAATQTVKVKEAAKVKPATTPTTTTGPLKKDGTADMRFKANKTKPATGPLKKDGTPDKRYKANKTN
jgi:hypothetical protein